MVSLQHENENRLKCKFSSISVTGQKIKLIQQLVSLGQSIVLLVVILGVNVNNVVRHLAVLVAETVVVAEDWRSNAAAVRLVDILQVRVTGGGPLPVVPQENLLKKHFEKREEPEDMTLTSVAGLFRTEPE